VFGTGRSFHRDTGTDREVDSATFFRKVTWNIEWPRLECWLYRLSRTSRFMEPCKPRDQSVLPYRPRQQALAEGTSRNARSISARELIRLDVRPSTNTVPSSFWRMWRLGASFVGCGRFHPLRVSWGLRCVEADALRAEPPSSADRMS
jgi:hypothetical protein